MKLGYIPLIGIVVIVYSIIALGGSAFIKDWRTPNTVPITAPLAPAVSAPVTSSAVDGVKINLEEAEKVYCLPDARGMQAFLDKKIFSIPMVSKDEWTVRWHDIFLIVGLIFLFQETIRSTGTGNTTVVNHILSMGVFVICIIEFLILRGFATSTFFLLMLMALIDVIGGFVISLKSARRDIGISGGGLLGGGGDN